MIETAITILLGVLGGVAVGTQGSMAGEMSRRIGATATSFYIHLSGAFLSGLLLLARRGEQIQNWRKLAWYMYGAGAFGVLLYITLARTVPRLGATAAMVLIIVGQLGVSVLIDHFGLFGLPARQMDGSRVVALTLLIAGAYLTVR